jgi:hypothetical protein
MTWTRGSIDGGETVNYTEDGDIHVTGKIDGGSNATLVSLHEANVSVVSQIPAALAAGMGANLGGIQIR